MLHHTPWTLRIPGLLSAIACARASHHAPIFSSVKLYPYASSCFSTNVKVKAAAALANAPYVDRSHLQSLFHFHSLVSLLLSYDPRSLRLHTLFYNGSLLFSFSSASSQIVYDTRFKAHCVV